MAIMKKSNKEDAVSPVIGVMLMLVVTIVIAAVVAAFASGMATSTETAPSVILKANVDASDSGSGTLYLMSRGGDTLLTDKIAVIAYNKDNNNAQVSLTAVSSSDTRFEPGSTVSYSFNSGANPGDEIQVTVRYNDYVLYNSEVIAE